MKRFLTVAAVSILAACSGPQPSSFVGEFQSYAAPKIAYDIADFVALHAKPTTGPIALEVASGDDNIGPTLKSDLESLGFTVSTSSPSHKLRYQVAGLGGKNILVRVFFDHGDAARMYSADGGLVAQGPFAERSPS
jgi:hypothetical protein